MPYKDIEKKRECQRRFYQRNKSYYTQKRQEKQKNIRSFLNDYKSNLKCKRCPENHIGCLEFHHNDPEEKEICISNIAHTGWGEERILKEIDKCIVLCANCHRKLHWNKWNKS